jgi:hypothetical protein
VGAMLTGSVDCQTRDVGTIAPVGAMLTGSDGIGRERYQAIFLKGNGVFQVATVSDARGTNWRPRGRDAYREMGYFR